MEALANLAVATAADHSTIAALMATIQQLTQLLDQAQVELAKRPTMAPNTTGPPRRNQARAADRFRYGNYCWSHGFCCGKEHTSATCKWPKEGHKREATVTNQLGGVTDKRQTGPPLPMLEITLVANCYSTHVQQWDQPNPP